MLIRALSLLSLCGLLAGCMASHDTSSRMDTLQSDTEVLDLRLTHVEERLARVEQDLGVIRSGNVPEGARWVDPSPSLAKYPGAVKNQDDSAVRAAVADLQGMGNASQYEHGTAQPKQVVEEPVRQKPPSLQVMGASQTLGTPQTLEASQGVRIPASQGKNTLPTSALSYGAGQGEGHFSTMTLGSQPAQTSPSLQNRGQDRGQSDGQSHPQGQPVPVALQATLAQSGQQGVNELRLNEPRLNESGRGRPVEARPIEARPIEARSGSPRSVTPASLKGLPPQFRSGVKSYDEALASYYRHEYGRAHKAFTAFIEHNKGHKLLPNALYWQGESAYSQGDFVGAILSFKSITSQFPKHPKSADALLKIGMSYERLKDPDNAQFYWQVLIDDFPKSSSARLARSKVRR